MLQSSPVRPTGQMQVGLSIFGPVLSHTPICEHLFLQEIKEQSGPSNPGSQMHLLNESHVPRLEQLFKHVLLLQSIPSNPGSHLHCPLKQYP